MGLCLSRNKLVKRKPCKRIANKPTRTRSSKTDNREIDQAFRDQAIAAAILFQRHLQNSGVSICPAFDRSTSVKHRPLKKEEALRRSRSTRDRSVADPSLHPHQLLNQNIKVDGVEINHFVLIHGGGFGAWCWYKTIALLNEAGFRVTAIDLAGSGVHSFDTSSITSLSQYVNPLTDFIEKLADNDKVILVGHDFGGACISYAMELFPIKISKAIFIAAAMLKSGQSALDMFSQKEYSNDLMRQAQIFMYTNGNNEPPTAIDFDKSLLSELLFNHSPAKDVALASVSMRSIPFSPVLEKLSLSDTNYGSVRRFYIETLDDNAVHVPLQENMINSNPPERVFHLKNADHSPFFSRPQSLHKLLVEIAQIP